MIGLDKICQIVHSVGDFDPGIDDAVQDSDTREEVVIRTELRVDYITVALYALMSFVTLTGSNLTEVLQLFDVVFRRYIESPAVHVPLPLSGSVFVSLKFVCERRHAGWA